MSDMMIKLFDLIGKPSAVLHSDGMKIYDVLRTIGGEDIEISFQGITHCTTAFLNASIGKYLLEATDSSAILRFSNLGEPSNLFKEKIEMVIRNIQDQKKRDILRSEFSSLFQE